MTHTNMTYALYDQPRTLSPACSLLGRNFRTDNLPLRSSAENCRVHLIEVLRIPLDFRFEVVRAKRSLSGVSRDRARLKFRYRLFDNL